MIRACLAIQFCPLPASNVADLAVVAFGELIFGSETDTSLPAKVWLAQSFLRRMLVFVSGRRIKRRGGFFVVKFRAIFDAGRFVQIQIFADV